MHRILMPISNLSIKREAKGEGGGVKNSNRDECYWFLQQIL